MLVHHKVKPHIRGDACHSRDDASVESQKTTLVLVHAHQGCPHAWQCFGLFSQSGEARRLDGQSRPNNIQWVRESDRSHAGDSTTSEAHEGRQVSTWVGLEDVALVEVVAAELDCRIGHDADAVGTITAHEPSPSFFLPHFLEGLAYRQLVLLATGRLYLEQDLESLQRGDNSAGHCTGDTASAECSDHGLADKHAEVVAWPRWQGRLRRGAWDIARRLEGGISLLKIQVGSETTQKDASLGQNIQQPS